MTTKRTVYIDKHQGRQSHSMDLRQKLDDKRVCPVKRERSPETETLGFLPGMDTDLRERMGKKRYLSEEEQVRQQKTPRGPQLSPWLGMIITDLHPHTIVEERGFLHLMRSLGYSSKIPPNATELYSELVQIYEQTKKKVMRDLQAAESVTLACDFWNSGAGQFLMTVTCHFINKSWKQESFVLETLIPEHSSSDKNVNQLVELAHTWGIEKKVHAMVTNANKLEQAVKEVGWEHLTCFAKTLDKLSRQTMRSTNVKKVLERCSELAEFFCHNTDAVKKLEKAQAVLGLPQHSLTSANRDSWLSTLNMLERISEQHEALRNILLDMKKLNLLLKKDDIIIMQSMMEALQTFKEVTDVMINDQHCSASNIIPCMEELKQRLKKQHGNKVAQSLVKHLCSDQFKPTPWLTMSTALDPRYKQFVLSDAKANESFLNFFTEMNLKMKDGDATSGGVSRADLRSLLVKYIKMSPLPREGNPLSFWRFNYKKLNGFACKHLNIVSTAMPLDRAFNIQKSQLMSRRRSILEPELLNMILFLNGNCSVE